MGSSNDDTRRWSIQLARDSHNVSFVPHLIDRLEDQGWNGTTTRQAAPGQKEIVTRGALAGDALEALRRLTFEDLGFDKQRWRRWLDANKGAGWESLLNQFVQRRLTQLPSAEPDVMNGWMGQLSEADSATVLPFIEQVLNHPLLASEQRVHESRQGGPALVVLFFSSSFTRAPRVPGRSCINAPHRRIRRFATSARSPSRCSIGPRRWTPWFAG